MNDFHEMLLKRHSIRRYTEQDIDPNDVRTIIEAALLAPSSKSARPWQFVIVDDPDMLRRLSKCKVAGGHPIAAAKMAVVVTVDPMRSDMYIEDAAVAAIMMHLQATALGIGSCWIQVRNREDAEHEPAENIVREALGIPNDMVVECIVTFGYPNEQRRPVDPEKLLWEKVHIGQWRPTQPEE